MALKHCISFVTDLAANFGCDRFRIMPDIISSFCVPTSEVTVLFDSNLSRRPFLGHVVDLDLLLCTDLFLCHISTQRPMTDRKIERSDERGFGRQQLLGVLANSIENFISHEKK